MLTLSMDRFNALNGHAEEHKPQNAQVSAFTETKSISISPRAIGTVGPSLNESDGQTSVQIPQPTQF